MSLTAKAGSDGTFELSPEGTHIARCYRLIDKGTSYDERWAKTSHKVLVSWELLGDEKMTNGEPFSVHRNYTVSLHEKAALRRDLVAWRGKQFTTEELAGFELPNVIGAPCMIQVVHNQDGDRTYANIASISALPKGMKAPPAVNAPVVFNLDDPDWDTFDALSDGIKAAIEKSDEYQTKWSDKAQVQNGSVPGVQAAAEMANAGAEPAAVDGGGDFSDDIPFSPYMARMPV